MLLKKGCNTMNKVSLIKKNELIKEFICPVEMWKTNVHIVVEILCGKLLEMPCRLGVEKHHICSDVSEQSITLSPPNVNTLIYIL